MIDRGKGKMEFTRDGIIEFMKAQGRIFDIVRLVDVSLAVEYEIGEQNEFVPREYNCYAVWNKERRCENCISAKAFALKTRLTKFEFVNDEVFYVMSAYTLVDGEPYMLEMVLKLNDETLFGTFGKNEFAHAIESYNKKVYVDVLTGAYNRRYFEEQIAHLDKINAVVMVDIDNFKTVNDTYGHQAGDRVLTDITRCMLNCVRDTDAVIRYGGDEFLLVFRNIPLNILADRLESIRASIAGIDFSEFMDMNVTVSVGAAFDKGSTEKMIKEADAALYRAKSSKNQVIIDSVQRAV